MTTPEADDQLSRPTRPIDPTDPRVELAAERTLLAWVRTGLAMMGFGFVVARFGLFLREMAAVGAHKSPGGHSGSLVMGVTLVGMGVVLLIVAGLRYRKYCAALRVGDGVPPPGQLFGLIVILALAMLGIFMVVYLLSIA